MKDRDTQILEEAYEQINERSEQWVVPEDEVEFVDWLKEYHPKWLKGHNKISTALRGILITSDGLGTEAKLKALEILLRHGEELNRL